jgi:DNA polymerase elongation subunit (family B)
MKAFYTNVSRYGNNILYVGYENNQRIHKSIKYNPTLFIPSKDPDSEYRTLDGFSVAPFKPGTMRECKEFIGRNEAVNFKIHGNRDYIGQFISEFFPEQCEFDRNLINITFLDIEVRSDAGFPKPELAEHEVTAITLKNNIDDTFYTWSLGDYDINKALIKDRKIVHVRCKDEASLLRKMLLHWMNNVPDVVSGWNVDYFDMTYLINRTIKVLGEDITRNFSIHKILPRAIENNYDGQHYEISGLVILDYLQLFKKFAVPAGWGNQESYKLDHIANVVLGEKKLDYSEYDSLSELYVKNHQKFIDYNIKDTDIVEKIDDKLGLITLAMVLSYKAGVNYNVVFGTTKIWDTYIYNVLIKKKIVISEQPPNTAFRTIEGGYVKPPIIGMHKWVMSFDLNSLYPHLIMMYNMSPETIGEWYDGVSANKLLAGVEVNIPPNRCLSATGKMFRTDLVGIFPQIVDNLYDERSVKKKKMIELQQKIQKISKKDVHARYEAEKNINIYHNEQHAIKILMNSLYGAMGNQYFRYYNTDVAEAITITGQLTIRWAEKTINKYMNSILKTEGVDYVIAMDTDSLYVNFGPLVDQVGITDNDKIVSFLDKVAVQKIEPVLEETFKELQAYLKTPQQRMVMKREVIASKVIFTGKKRYVANVINSEGVQYAEPKVKIVGIESVRSSTPQVCRKLIEKTLKIILNEDEKALQNFVKEARDNFSKLRAEDVSFPRGLNNLEKYSRVRTKYAKGTPIHVRAAILFNKLIVEKNINKKYEEIYEGNKIKFCYLKIPNPIHENVIGFQTTLPEEFNLHQYIDYNKQFEKSYVDPIKGILDAIGWNLEPINTLEGFFK